MLELHLVCGRCGVPASTLLTFTCPGCGADVREVGIGRRAGGRGPAGSVFRWTILAAALLGGALLGQGFIPHSEGEHERHLRPTDPRTAPEALLTANGSGFSSRCALDDVTMRLLAPSGRTLVRVDAASLRYATLDAQLELVEQPGRLTQGVMLIILSSIGFDPTDPATRQAAGELMSVIAAAHAGDMLAARPQSFPLTSGGGMHKRVLNRALVNGTLFTGLAVWVVGVWLIFRRYQQIRVSPTPGLE